MLKGKYEKTLDQFELYYPDLYSQTVDWWPSGQLCITVKLKDSLLFEFNPRSHTIRRVQTDTYTRDAEALRKEIGHNLQKIILTRGLPQSYIAEKVGITEAMLSRYIHGTSMPGIDKIYNIANVLDCRVTDLLGELYEE